MIEVKERTLRPFEQHVLPATVRVQDDRLDVADEGSKTLPEFEVLVETLFEL